MSKTARVALVGGVLAVLGLALNAVIAFVTDWSGDFGWIAAPVVSVLGAALTAVVDDEAKRRFGDGSGGTGGGYSPYPVRHRSSPTAVVAAVLVVAVLVVAATFGVRYAVGYVSGAETGTSVLAKGASGKAGRMTAKVTGVEHTDHFTRVTVEVRNDAATSTSLPLFGNCTLTGSDGTTLQADSFRSDWATTFAPGVTQRGTITFPGHLPAAVTSARLTFATVFTQGPGGGALAVKGIRLAPDRVAA